MNITSKRSLSSNKILPFIVALIVGVTMALFNSSTAHAIQDWDGEYFTYGAGLSKEQLKETERLLGVPDDIERVMVDSSDYNKYTGLSTKNSSLYSSAIIMKTKKGSGVNVYINTPGNITQIEDHQYLNAALTSGLTDADIVIGSPVKVTGESALVGLYKALDVAGVEVNEEAAKVASEELSVVNEISQGNVDNAEFDSKELTLALAEIKEKIAEIADKDSLTKEEIEEIVNNVLDSRGLQLSESHKAMIVNWANKFKALDIDWKAVGDNLKKIGNSVSEKAGKLYDWGKESGFFTRIWDSIKAFFQTLFS